ncbi:MAG TPA: ACT domain-containing protein, partial [Terriglobia bacterium]|nr:ACT domain-containing protein [Terriglobia bacterium]
TRGADGLGLFVRPVLVPQSSILSSVQGSYNAIWVKGTYGEDTLYYGRGAGKPTGVAVVSDIMRAARDLRSGAKNRVPSFAFGKLEEVTRAGIESQVRPYYLRFLVEDRAGIIAQLATVLAEQQINIDAVLEEPGQPPHNLPFMISVKPTSEAAIAAAVAKMQAFDFLCEPPLALPIETLLAG